jgi:hypothetical protein
VELISGGKIMVPDKEFKKPWNGKSRVLCFRLGSEGWEREAGFLA